MRALNHNADLPNRNPNPSPPQKRGRGRPPKTDGAQRETRERLIRCGIEILTEHGFASTSIDAVLKKVGVPKGSFYHYFASKDDFGRVVIEGYAAYFAAKLDHWLLDESRLPLDRLRDFINDAQDGMVRHDFRRGCLIGNMGQELGGTHDDFRILLEGAFLDWQDRIERCLNAAQKARQIPPQANCAELAAFFWISWEGAILRSKLVRSTAPLNTFAEAFFKSLAHP